MNSYRLTLHGPRRLRWPTAVFATVVVLAGLLPGSAPAVLAAPSSDHVTIVMSEPTTLDPAAAPDADSAAVIAQVFEGLTWVDAAGEAQPALAASWQLSAGDTVMTFTLHDGLAFSDGSPLTADDVVRSWFRVLDPASPSSLATLLYGVTGAEAYSKGTGDKSAVGISASGNTVKITFLQSTSDFATVVASPTLAIVPASATSDAAFLPNAEFVASGGYIPISTDPTGIELKANPRFWAGRPAIATATITWALAQASELALEGGDVDYVPVDGSNAPWMTFDKTLGPQLRSWADPTTVYFGFDTTQKPFDDVRVRQAFSKAVDWKRVVQLDESGGYVAATSLVPPGTPARPTGDNVAAYDPAGARALLVQAGYVDPTTFPTVTLVGVGPAGNVAFQDTVVEELHANLGIDVRSEAWSGDEFSGKASGRVGKAGGPAFWETGWQADYPSPNDFLGFLLGSGQVNNYGHWSNPDFDAKIAQAVAASDEASAQAAYSAAEAIVKDQAPVIPVAYLARYALSRNGLLGASTNATGQLRLANMAWASGKP